VYDVACISGFSILGLCSVHCVRCFLYLWILHSWFVFCVLRTMFPVSLESQFLVCVNTNQEWRLQRYRQHRAQYTEHKPTMENPEIQETSCAIHRTQTKNGESVSVDFPFLVCVLCIAHDVSCICGVSILGLCSVHFVRCCLYLWILHAWFVFILNTQNTNQEWRIQRYRQHRAQYIEHKPRMENPERCFLYLWILLSWSVFCVLCTMLPVSLDSSFLVLVLCIVHDVACISGISILETSCTIHRTRTKNEESRDTNNIVHNK
jgi:hypothetical protein